MNMDVGSIVRVLVLEDEPVILMDLSFALEDLGATPVSATSVEKALDAISENPPQSAILDVNLGMRSTCEPVANKLAELGIPFLLHSGDLVRQGEFIARIGAEVIPKPSDSNRVAGRALVLARQGAV